MAIEHSDPIIVVKLQDGLADRHRLPLNHVISVLEEVRNMVTDVGREMQRERGLEKLGDFGLELLAEEGGIIFKKGSVEAAIAITSNVQDGFLAAQKIVKTVEQLRSETRKMAASEDLDVSIVRRLSRIARIQRTDKTKLALSVRAPRHTEQEHTPDYSALFDQAAIDNVRSLQAPTFSVEGTMLFGKLVQLRDKDEEEESHRGFWGELTRENGEQWRIQFKATDVDMAAHLFRKQVAVTGKAFYFRAQSPKLVAQKIVPETDRDYEKVFDELYGCDKEFYKSDLASLLRELRGE